MYIYNNNTCIIYDPVTRTARAGSLWSPPAWWALDTPQSVYKYTDNITSIHHQAATCNMLTLNHKTIVHPPPLSVNWLSAVMLNFDNICVVFPGWHCNNMIKWFVQDLMADNETSSLFCKYGVISCWHYDLLMLITGLWWLSLEWYFMNISKYQPLASPHCPVAHNGTLCILSNN